MALDVIIPAGGHLEGELAKQSGVTHKALIRIGERTILRTLLEELKASSRVRRVILVGIPAVIEHPDAHLADVRLEATGNSAPANIAIGLRELNQASPPPDQVIIVTADLPFFHRQALDDFLNKCQPGKDFYVPLIAKEDWDERLPGISATFAKLKDGEFTTGCLYLATTKGLAVAMPHLEKVFANRKSKLKIAGQLGVKFVWDYINERLTVDDVERKIMEILNVNGAAVPASPPELAFDIDYPEDMIYAMDMVAGKT